MMFIASLSSTANTALSGISQAIQQVEEVAQNVETGVTAGPESQLADGLGEISRLAGLRQQAVAGARVFSEVEEIFAELASIIRR